MVDKAIGFFVINIYGNRLCLPWTVLVGRATDLSGMLLLIGPYDLVAYFMSYRAGLNIRQPFNVVLGLV